MFRPAARKLTGNCGCSRIDSFKHARKYVKSSKLSLLIGESLRGNSRSTSSRSFSCCSGLMANRYIRVAIADEVYQDNCN